MPDRDEKYTVSPGFRLPPAVIWSIMAFLLGLAVSWGRSTGNIDTLSRDVSALVVKVDLLNTQFIAMNGDTRERLKGVESSVSNLQDQIRDIRATQQEEAAKRK